MIGNIARLQLRRIAKRINERHKILFTYDNAVDKLIVSRSITTLIDPRPVHYAYD
jgi:type VI secretion system protein VasG